MSSRLLTSVNNRGKYPAPQQSDSARTDHALADLRKGSDDIEASYRHPRRCPRSSGARNHSGRNKSPPGESVAALDGDGVAAAAGGRSGGEAVALATALEVATTPLGTSSAGFVFKLDPDTGLQVRTATTFGPSFAERALTTGEGKVSVGATLSVATYDKLNDLNLAKCR